jgi:ribosome-binding protein aMBF1 (putative translation factor)
MRVAALWMAGVLPATRTTAPKKHTIERDTWRRCRVASRVPVVANKAKDPQVALGRAVSLRREELGLSQQELADRTDDDQSWISHVENGHSNPAYGIVDGLARALELSLEQLVALAQSLETRDRRPLDRPLAKPKTSDSGH